MDDVHIRHADTQEDLRACFGVMQQLRPHLQTYEDFAQRVRRMSAERYRILSAWNGQASLAVAGYRLQENLIYGRFLYVDDLVTTVASRGRNLGARLLAELSGIAARQGCEKLVLDTGLANALAQRFYFRQGLVTGAIRFSKSIDKEEQ
ncbi:MAG TPA: GNAT family N-acetyltransferase [Bordetella sp.]|nr:GNAT family N-acetyltransferase [Bordetella sp.]